MILSNTNSRRNIYLILLMKSLIVLITVIVLDFIIGSILKTFYFRQTSGEGYHTTYSIEKTDADLLIFGSSTAIHNYVPETFKKQMNISAYNVGRDGISIFYDYAILKTILKRYSPKVIILDFDPQEFKKDQESYDRLSCLLPYYKKYPEIQRIVDLKSPYEKYKLLSNIYPYNSSIFTIAIGNTEYNKTRRGDINGYVPINTIWDDPIKDSNTFLNYPADSNKIKIYKCFIEDCIRAKVELYIVASPLFIKPGYKNNSVTIGKAIADKYHVKFLDYSKDSMFLNSPKLFADVSHLNDDGAVEYSNTVSDKILSGENATNGINPQKK